MELALYFTAVPQIDDLEEAIRPLPLDGIPGFVAEVLSRDEYGAEEYLANGLATTFLAQPPVPLELGRLYFGQEFCEHLIPSADEAREAYFLACQLDLSFTYTTGYVTAAGLERTLANVGALAAERQDLEVVVNDWGVLRVLRREFPACRPVLGRLLTKQPRLSRYTDHAPPMLRSGIRAAAEDVHAHQIEALRETDLGLPLYADLLRHHGVTRIDLDPTPQGLDPAALPAGFGFSLYAPWTCAATSRTCRTAALVDRRRESAVVAAPCPGPCRHANRNRTGVRTAQPVLLRGNSAFAYNLTYVPRYLDGLLPVDRLVFEPYIPL